MGQCLGGSNGTESQPNAIKMRSTSIGAETRLKSNIVGLFQFCEQPAKRRIPVRTYAAPLLYKDTKIIFLSGALIRNQDTGDLESQYLSSYYIKDLTNDKIEKQEINCGDIQIDILPTSNACVYTLNPDNDKIYFIVNNKEIITLDLSTNTLQSINKEISDIEGTDNLAQIGYLDGKICIMGPDKITNNDDEKDDDYLYKVPYKLGNNEDANNKCKFDKFGKLPRIINAKINDKNHILMMGGVKFEQISQAEDKKENDEENVALIPHDQIFITDGNGYVSFAEERASKGKSPKLSPKMMKMLEYHTAYPLYSFGIINYKDEYLFQFGGIEGLRNGGLEKMKVVRVLRLKKTKNETDKYGLKRFTWYSLEMKIPKLCTGFCHALYVPSMDNVELFNYFGKNFRFPAKALFDQLKKGEQKTMDNPNPIDPDGKDRKIVTEGWKGLTSWTEAGKTVNPTKSNSFKNLGPQLDSEVDEMLRDLGEPYDQYVNMMNDFPMFKDVTNKANLDVLKGIIKDRDHLQKIIETAKEESE